MRTTSTRQKQLYLVAKFYDLAAEFSLDELKIIRDDLSASNEQLAIRRAVDALIRLHGVGHESHLQQMSSGSKNQEIDKKEQEKAASVNVRYLEEIFNNKSIFPLLHDVAAVVPGLSPVHKESRSRYIKRIIHHVSSMGISEKKKFMDGLAVVLNKQPSNFISQWKVLIKDL
jgi:hypothetical protein